MKISELIERLAQVLQTAGDVEVVKSIGKKTAPITQLEIITEPRKHVPIRL